MKKTGLLFILLLFPLLASAQNRTLVKDLEKEEPGKGRVQIEMDARIDSLLGPVSEALSGEKVKATGFRIQVYAGNNTRTSKEQAAQADKFMHENFPQLSVYTLFKSPRWLCVVGDFLSYEEAYETLRMLKKETQFKQMIILRNQEINVSL